MRAVAYPTSVDLPELVRAEVIEVLNLRLGEALDLENRARQARWNVKGPQFLALHALFGELHRAANGYADILAERVVQLGGVAGASATPPHRPGAEFPVMIPGAPKHVRILHETLALFGRHIRRAGDATAELGDRGASSICTEISRDIDRWLWFIEAHAQGNPCTVEGGQ